MGIGVLISRSFGIRIKNCKKKDKKVSNIRNLYKRAPQKKYPIIGTTKLKVSIIRHQEVPKIRNNVYIWKLVPNNGHFLGCYNAGQ